MAASSMHTRKRQYQPSNQTRLTSFFDNVHTPVPRPSLSPELPHDVAASLLSVGMRVRKSVPEGYKNKSPFDSTGFPIPSSAPPTLNAPVQSRSSPTHTRELMPFCGLHKTGGWAAQEVLSSSAPAIVHVDCEEDDAGEMPGLSISQTTVMSSQQSFASIEAARTPSRKRIYEEETETLMDKLFDELGDNAKTSEQAPPSRRIAQPKPSLQRSRSPGNVRIFGSDDFEEAAFLVPLERDMDLRE